MKRSIVMVLAGFGLASMLFALVAFVGGSYNEGSGLVHVRVMERYGMGKGYILIAYPNGSKNKIEIETNPIFDYKRVLEENSMVVTKTLNELSKEHTLLSHSASAAEGFYIENYIFQTKN